MSEIQDQTTSYYISLHFFTLFTLLYTFLHLFTPFYTVLHFLHFSTLFYIVFKPSIFARVVIVTSFFIEHRYNNTDIQCLYILYPRSSLVLPCYTFIRVLHFFIRQIDKTSFITKLTGPGPTSFGIVANSPLKIIEPVKH